MHGELQGVGILIECDAKKYSEPTNCHNIISSAG